MLFDTYNCGSLAVLSPIRQIYRASEETRLLTAIPKTQETGGFELRGLVVSCDVIRQGPLDRLFDSPNSFIDLIGPFFVVSFFPLWPGIGFQSSQLCVHGQCQGLRLGFHDHRLSHNHRCCCGS